VGIKVGHPWDVQADGGATLQSSHDHGGAEDYLSRGKSYIKVRNWESLNAHSQCSAPRQNNRRVATALNSGSVFFLPHPLRVFALAKLRGERTLMVTDRFLDCHTRE
jgi:hypothetical protein